MNHEEHRAVGLLRSAATCTPACRPPRRSGRARMPILSKTVQDEGLILSSAVQSERASERERGRAARAGAHLRNRCNSNAATDAIRVMQSILSDNCTERRGRRCEVRVSPLTALSWWIGGRCGCCPTCWPCATPPTLPSSARSW